MIDDRFRWKISADTGNVLVIADGTQHGGRIIVDAANFSEAERHVLEQLVSCHNAAVHRAEKEAAAAEQEKLIADHDRSLAVALKERGWRVVRAMECQRGWGSQTLHYGDEDTVLVVQDEL